MAGSAAPRLVDVARLAGVSVSSASRALAGRDGVRAEVVARVRDVAEDLGYVVNVHARSLAGVFASSVGLLIHEVADPYFAEIASGVMRVASERRLSVQICHTGRDPDNELRQVRALVANRVGVIVVAGSGYVDPLVEGPIRAELERFADIGGRVVVIGRHHLVGDAVLPDNVTGGRRVAEHLVTLGHRRIAVVGGSLGLTTVADRLRGVREALTAAGLDPDRLVVREAAFTREGGKEATRRVLETHPDLTAVLALNDDMAIGALSVLRAAGVEVPREVSVTGFDDVAVAEDLSPGLTTVRLPMTRMGEQALELALRPPASRPRRVRLPATLVVRDSTAPPR